MSLYFKQYRKKESIEIMENQKYSLVLRVRDIQKCRTFYRNTLGLGSPVLDSPFWVEFQMSDGGKLCLEAADPEMLSATGSSAVWMMEADEELMEQLSLYKLPEQNVPSIMGYSVTAFRDPEGNVFYLTVRKQMD